MPFTKEATRVANGIGGINITMHTTGPSGAGGQVTYEVKVIYSDGTVVVRSGDLIPQLTPAQLSSLISFMDVMRTKAIAEFLP